MPIKKFETVELTTAFEDVKSFDWNEYPRPQMRRDSYLSLCGKWEFSVKDGSKVQSLENIEVPFVPESRLSGIGRSFDCDEKYIYKRHFIISENFNKGEILLHFGAVDTIAKVWVNGNFVGEHIGGYLPFWFEIGAFTIIGKNEICVEVTDTLDTELAYGKQRRKRGGMWYTPISGIWQTVWLESVPKDYIKSFRITPSLNSIKLEIEGGQNEKTLIIHTEKGDKIYRFDGENISVEIEEPINWSPENPYLYNFTLTSGEDCIKSYFALRTVAVKSISGKDYICLNDKPYFFHALLDQGYFSDGIYLPSNPSGFLWDIQNMKRLGFNTLRKHIKIEPDIFYYYCDKYGMIVFQDMVNSGKYSFFFDTVLPTIGLKRGITHSASEKRRKHFEENCFQTVAQLYNHPSVCYYTIFNEGWGQYDADRIYGEMKALDSTRVWDTTSGWFTEKQSDVKSEHIYFKKIKLKAKPSKALVLSEFGGYSCNIKGHIFNPKKSYGYRKFDTKEQLTTALENLYLKEIIPAIKQGLCACVLTQLSDVEDETNGLCTYDRKVIKVDRKKMLEISTKIQETFAKQTNLKP